MSKTTILLGTVLLLAAAAAAADDLSDVSDRDLERDLGEVERELRTQERLLEKLDRSGASSSNAGRRSAVADIQDHMIEIVYDREDLLGREHTIMRHGGTTTTGLTDAARVGTPMATKKTRRRVRQGAAEEHPEALRRLTRMQTIAVAAARIEVPAVERQGDAFERFQGLCEEFAEILRTEYALVHNELQRRAEAAAPSDSTAAEG